MNPGTLKKAIRAALVACVITAGAAAQADTSFNGGDLGDDSRWSNGKPDANTQAYTWGKTTATTSSVDNITAKGLEIAASSATTLWNLGGHTFTAGTFAIGATTTHDINFILTNGTFSATAYNGFYIGMNGAYGNKLTLADATLSLESGSRMVLGSNSSTASGDNNSLLVGTNSTLSIKSQTLNVGIQGDNNSVSCIGSKEVSLGNNVFVGQSAGACNNKFVMRDVAKASLSGIVYVGNADGAVGNSMLISNVTDLTVSNPLYVGWNGACSTCHVYQAQNSTKLVKVNVGSYGTASNSYAMVDGGGASVTTAYFEDYAKVSAPGSTVELRNMTITTTDQLNHTSPDLHWIIGPGATFASTCNDYSSFPLAGARQTLTVDGGTVSFKGSNGSSGSLYLNGEKDRLTVKNNGKVELTNKLQVGGWGSSMEVLSGGTLTAKNILFDASNLSLTISNVTVNATGGLYIPDSDDEDGYKGWATNNVIRFAGENPRLNVGQLYAWWKKVGDEYSSQPIFEFVLPKYGYDEIPVIADSIWFRETKKPRLHIDATAYRGDRDWMTLMRTPDRTSETPKVYTMSLDLESFASELPANCSARIVSEGGYHKLQLQVRNPRGLIIIFR